MKFCLKWKKGEKENLFFLRKDKEGVVPNFWRMRDKEPRTANVLFCFCVVFVFLCVVRSIAIVCVVKM